MTSLKKNKALLLAGPLALVTWASWESPDLHQYAPPTRIAQLHVASMREPAQAARTQQLLLGVPGVTACVINAKTRVATLFYKGSTISEAELMRILSVGGTFTVTPLHPAAPDPQARQCPVPAGYVTALEQLRFALNLRRLFVRV